MKPTWFASEKETPASSFCLQVNVLRSNCTFELLGLIAPLFAAPLPHGPNQRNPSGWQVHKDSNLDERVFGILQDSALYVRAPRQMFQHVQIEKVTFLMCNICVFLTPPSILDRELQGNPDQTLYLIEARRIIVHPANGSGIALLT